MLALMVIIDISSTGGSGSASMKMMVQRTIKAVPMTSVISEKMPWVLYVRRLLHQASRYCEVPENHQDRHALESRGEPRMESCHTKSRCRDGKETSREDKDKDSNNRSK